MTYHAIKQMLVVARRDFTSIVFTPTFLVFLLAPLMMIGFGMMSGLGAEQIAKSQTKTRYALVLASAQDTPAIHAAEQRLRKLFRNDDQPVSIRVLADVPANAAEIAAARRQITGDDGQAVPVRNKAAGKADALARQGEIVGLMEGPMTAPTIWERNQGGSSGRLLASIAESVAREGRDAMAPDASRPTFKTMKQRTDSDGMRRMLGTSVVFVIFMLTLMLAGQSVGMLTEEKGNKVIEILAAAAPLEAVFFGKLLAMLAVALMFVLFWAAMLMVMAMVIGGSLFGAGALAGAGAVGSGLGGASAGAATNATALLSFAPAIGWPLFCLFALLYFLMAFLLLGAIFLGLGAQASSVREVQMLSLPMTFFQMAMFAMSTAAAGMPESRIATIAQIFPFSSPFAMAARGATDAAIWPHVLALLWQGLWVGLTIWLAVRFFRAGVLRSGGLRLPWRKVRQIAG